MISWKVELSLKIDFESLFGHTDNSDFSWGNFGIVLKFHDSDFSHRDMWCEGDRGFMCSAGVVRKQTDRYHGDCSLALRVQRVWETRCTGSHVGWTHLVSSRRSVLR